MFDCRFFVAIEKHCLQNNTDPKGPSPGLNSTQTANRSSFSSQKSSSSINT